jgi:hypothetical protein
VKKCAVVLAVPLLAATGCSGSVEGPVIASNRSTDGTDAEVFGEVVIESDCLYLLWSDEAGTRFPVVWPYGTSWNVDESAVVLPDGSLVYEGVRVEGGGGYYDEDALSNYTVPDGVALAQLCVD